MEKVKNIFSKQYSWYVTNLQKIIFVAGLHFVLSYFVQLPYINIFTSLFSFLPFFFDWVAILILFKPKKEFILKVGLLLFGVSFFLALIKFNFALEIMGEMSYLLIGTYIIFSLRELGRKSI